VSSKIKQEEKINSKGKRTRVERKAATETKTGSEREKD
jgi:hypothetical protein